MRTFFLIAALAVCTGPVCAQDNTGAIDQQTSSSASSATTTSSSGFDTPQSDSPPENQGSSEMEQWIKSNASSESSSSSSDFSAGFGHDNDRNDDDRPSWSRHQAARPTPEQMDGTYRVSAVGGPFLCTVQLSANPYFNGYWAVTSSGCPELWKVVRWQFDGPSLVLTNSSGDAFATFWPRGRDLWVGRSTTSGQRLSLSR